MSFNIVRQETGLVLFLTLGGAVTWGWLLRQALVQDATAAAATFGFTLGVGVTAGVMMLTGQERQE